MSEMSSFEQPEVKREDVIAAFRKFVDRGITSPDALDLNDPEVIEANRLLDSWWEKEEKSVPEGDKMANHVRTMIMVDAGFSDSNYLLDVLDWLNQDLENAEEADLETADKIREAIARVRALLPKE